MNGLKETLKVFQKILCFRLTKDATIMH